MQALSRSEPRRGPHLAIALGALLTALVVVLTFAAPPAGAAAAPGASPTAGAAQAPKACPGFRVLHNDRIGAAAFPTGSYTITLEDTSLTCKAGSELFARFLESFDGVLPRPWKVSAEGSGKATFSRGSQPGLAVALSGRGGEEGGRNPILGTLCPHPFTVNSSTVVGPLRFTKGKFLIYLPTGSGITCNRAAVLFTRFLGAGGTLPPPWRLTTGAATFYKPSNPTRSAFRIEPLAGAGRR